MNVTGKIKSEDTGGIWFISWGEGKKGGREFCPSHLYFLRR